MHGVELSQCIFSLLKLNCRWLVNKAEVCTEMLHANVAQLFSESPLISLAHSLLLYFSLSFSLAYAQTHSGTHVNTSPAV